MKCNGPNNNNCFECPAGTFLNPVDHTCTTTCLEKYYKNSTNNKCEQCDSSCKNCSDKGSDKCIECDGALYFKDEKYCSSTCHSNEFGNSLNNKCEPCDLICNSCSGKADFCTSCSGLTFLSGTDCVSNCPSDTFENTSNNFCQKCNIECEKCNGPSKFECLSCPSGTFLNNLTNSCSSRCPDKYYPDLTTKLCLSCIKNCDNCNDD